MRIWDGAHRMSAGGLAEVAGPGMGGVVVG